MIENSDYFIHYVCFPNKVNPALTVVNDDGTFDIYLNALYDREYLCSALKHELEHLEKEHFYVDVPVKLAERQADGENPYANVFHPPEGMIPHFFSEAAFAHWVKTVCAQKHLDLSTVQVKW